MLFCSDDSLSNVEKAITGTPPFLYFLLNGDGSFKPPSHHGRKMEELCSMLVHIGTLVKKPNGKEIAKGGRIHRGEAVAWACVRGVSPRHPNFSRVNGSIIRR